MPVASAHSKLRHDDRCKFKASLDCNLKPHPKGANEQSAVRAPELQSDQHQWSLGFNSRHRPVDAGVMRQRQGIRSSVSFSTPQWVGSSPGCRRSYLKANSDKKKNSIDWFKTMSWLEDTCVQIVLVYGAVICGGRGRGNIWHINQEQGLVGSLLLPWTKQS